MTTKKSARTLTASEKQSIVEEYIKTNDLNVVAEKHNISTSTLRTWKKKYLAGETFERKPAKTATTIIPEIVAETIIIPRNPEYLNLPRKAKKKWKFDQRLNLIPQINAR